ncbi:hypothetical protein E1A91_D02G200800v1, partial [Gossypium mustelinum]
MLTFRFEKLMMQEAETISEFYSKLYDLSNQAIALREDYSNTKLIRKVLRSRLEKFSIEVTTIDKAMDHESLTIDELIYLLQTF